MTKKLISIILSFAILFCMFIFPANAVAAPQLSLESKTVKAGETVEIPVKITNAKDVYNGNFTLQYDSDKLSIDSYTIGTIYNGHNPLCNTDYQQKGNLIRFTFSGAYALTGDGTLVMLKFKAKEAVSGTAALTFTAYKIYDANGVSLSPTAENGSVTVEPKPVVPAAQASLSLSSAKAKAESKVEITLSLDKNPGIAGLVLTLQYDTSVLTLDSVTNGKLFGSLTTGKNLIWDADKNITGTGELAVLTFSVNKNAAAGEYSVDAVVRSCADIDTESVDVNVGAGKITVIDFIYGDANDDDIIDIKDVVILRNYLANYDYETDSPTVAVGFGADANADNIIDIKDVVILRNYLANYDYETDTPTVVLGPQ